MPDLLPAVFVGHGNPMNALEHNRYTEAWSSFGAALPTPRAILVVSAHWFVNITAVTAMARPRTIHDFYGFPPALFDVTYPAPGDPEVAARVVEVVKPTYVGLDEDSWGIDHGTWSVLVHMFPRADVPVLQLSINASEPLSYHFELGAKLHALRAEGVLIVASGNVVHNLRGIAWGSPDSGADWARRFDDAVEQIMVASPGGILEMTGHPDYPSAVPTPDHFIPLLYIAALAAAGDEQPEVLAKAYQYGSLSMTCYTVGAGSGEARP